MTNRRILFVTLYAIAMGFLEAAVVVYLRRIYYPQGFDFPLVPLPMDIALVELGREIATVIMLVSVAVLAGRTGVERFAWFSVLFGIWDIVYYLGLKLVLDWPPSLMTWDILFLLPVIWAGPVLAPLIVSTGLIAGGGTLLSLEARRIRIALEPVDQLLLAASLLMLLVAFMMNALPVAGGESPHRFPWWLFTTGCLLAAVIGLKALRFNRRRTLPRRYGLR